MSHAAQLISLTGILALPEEQLQHIRIQLQDGSLVRLRDNYMNEIRSHHTRAPGADSNWLTFDGESAFFLTRTGVRHRLYIDNAAIENNAPSVHLIIDQSSSMECVSSAVFDAARELINNLSTETQVTVSRFGSRVTLGTRGTRDEAIAELQTFSAAGLTSLYDAVVQVIDSESPSHTSSGTIILLTDGVDTTSRATCVDARAKVMGLPESWKMMFLGSNQDAILSGGTLGIPRERSLTMAHTATGVRNAMRSVSSMHATGAVMFTPQQRHVSMGQ